MEVQLENCFDPVLVAPPSRRTKHPLHSLTPLHVDSFNVAQLIGPKRNREKEQEEQRMR